MMSSMTRILCLRPLVAATLVLAWLLVTATAARGSSPEATSAQDLSLKGDQDGTVFRSLTVEGENQVQIRFARPALGIDIDPNQAPGLMLDDALDILNRTRPDLVAPFLLASTTTATTHAPRPWLTAYATGPLARFTPVMAGVDGWKLLVVDSRGQTTMVFAGRGNPPAEIAWDGLRLDGTPAPPGYTYSYVLEARDDAGNQRRFVGDGFSLPAYRRDDAPGPEFLMSGAQWQGDQPGGGVPSALALEAASWFNLRCEPTRLISVIATHRTVAEASALAQEVAAALSPHLAGAPGRVVAVPRVAAGAPPAGTLRLTSRPVVRPPAGES